MPNVYFRHFVAKLNAKVNALRLVCHKAQPCYQSKTKRISYKIFDVDGFLEVLDEGKVDFQQEVLFTGYNHVENETTPLSAEEEIQRAKQMAHAPATKRKRPSSKTSLIVGYGEGRATRELEVIWWPDLYNLSEHGQMVIRFFLKKCEF